VPEEDIDNLLNTIRAHLDYIENGGEI